VARDFCTIPMSANCPRMSFQDIDGLSRAKFHIPWVPEWPTHPPKTRVCGPLQCRQRAVWHELPRTCADGREQNRKRRADRGPPIDLLRRFVVPDFVPLPHRTESTPEDHRGRAFDGVDLITALRIRGSDAEYVLLPGKMKATLGYSGDCDISVDNKRF